MSNYPTVFSLLFDFVNSRVLTGNLVPNVLLVWYANPESLSLTETCLHTVVYFNINTFADFYAMEEFCDPSGNGPEWWHLSMFWRLLEGTRLMAQIGQNKKAIWRAPCNFNFVAFEWP